jgi:hypothetical protein
VQRHSQANELNCFCDLKIEADSLTVDEYSAGMNELLTAAVVLLVAVQSRERGEELHRFRSVAGCGFSRQVDGRAEPNPVELRLSPLK